MQRLGNLLKEVLYRLRLGEQETNQSYRAAKMFSHSEVDLH